MEIRANGHAHPLTHPFFSSIIVKYYIYIYFPNQKTPIFPFSLSPPPSSSSFFLQTPYTVEYDVHSPSGSEKTKNHFECPGREYDDEFLTPMCHLTSEAMRETTKSILQGGGRKKPPLSEVTKTPLYAPLARPSPSPLYYTSIPSPGTENSFSSPILANWKKTPRQ